AEAHGRAFGYAPSVGADFDRPPALISQIEIDATAMLCDTEVNRPLRTVELCLRFEQIERRADRRRARGGPGQLVIASPQPKSKPLAADRPGFPVAVDHEISECRTSGGVEQLAARIDRGEHRGPRQTGVWLSTTGPSDMAVRSAVAGSVPG